MRGRSRKRIALAAPLGMAFLERLIRGIMDYARQHAHWSFSRVETLGTSIDWLRHWDGNGAFALVVTPEDARTASRLRMPVVNLALNLPNVRLPCVTVDDYAIGELAARHLLERNFRRFGCYGAAHLQYALLRREGFCNTVAQAGGEWRILDVQSAVGARQRLGDEQAALERWLRGFQPPVGVMARTDLRANMVLEACRALRLRVPEDVAVVGVDNDPVVCNFCDPALTSVSRNDYQVGYEAAALLDRLMAGGDAPKGPLRVPPEGVVQRGSTDTVAVEDSYVAQAIAFMRGHVKQRFGVEQLLKELSISRRSLEYRFRASLGRSPYDYLNQIRVDHAKSLLIEPQKTSLSKIAVACGFGDVRRFRIVFQRLVGVSPAQYRRSALRIDREAGPHAPAPRSASVRARAKTGGRAAARRGSAPIAVGNEFRGQRDRLAH